MEFVDGVLIILLIVVSAGLWIVLMNMKKSSETANQITQARLDLLAKQIPDQDSFVSLGKRLQSIDTASRHSFERLSKDLGGLSKATEQMMEVGKTISSLEDLLKPPKLRGGMGETLLEEGDGLVINQTKVFPARVFGINQKNDRKVEVFFLKEVDDKLNINQTCCRNE